MLQSLTLKPAIKNKLRRESDTIEHNHKKERNSTVEVASGGINGLPLRRNISNIKVKRFLSRQNTFISNAKDINSNVLTLNFGNPKAPITKKKS